MKDLKKNLKDRGVFFSSKLPAYNKVLKSLFPDLSRRRLMVKSQPWAVGSDISLPDLSGSDGRPIVICDRKLRLREDVKSWLKNYPVYFVTAGETLKDLKTFPKHIQNILNKTKDIAGFISLGGGSVGDFTGFLASVYKRGMPVAHIPGTFLSAMDSAHGGKTALNVCGIKNFIGSYFFPKAVFIVKDLLSSLPKKEKESAKGELVKIALIEGGSLYKKLLKSPPGKWDLWNLLPQAVFAKLKTVQKDPFETKGQRRLLNFGHTLGHALESYFRIPHGQAVLYGMAFAVQWSRSRFNLSDSFLEELSFLLPVSVVPLLKKMPKKTLQAMLLQDKKRACSKSLHFVFIKAPGRLFTEELSLQDILKEVKRQSQTV